LTSSIYKDFKILNTKTINNTINKWANELNRQFSKKKYKWQISEEILNIFSHTGSSNGNNTDILSHPRIMIIFKQTKNNECLLRCKKNGNMHCFWDSDVDIITGVSSRN
jgi:hypothetical protein